MSVHPMPLNKIWIIAIHAVLRTPRASTRRPSAGSVGGLGVNAGSFDAGVLPAHHFIHLSPRVTFGDGRRGARRAAFPMFHRRAWHGRPAVFRSWSEAALAAELII
jgi:hypothetical protein